VLRVKAAFKEQGFGILTEIDIKATLKEKIDADVGPYVILGACATWPSASGQAHH
jgi:uncharacterized protein (DUF302 family)